MDIIKEYSFDYCWNMGHMMDELFDYRNEFLAPIPTHQLSAVMAKQPHPADVERAWHDDPLRKFLLSQMVKYEG